MIFFCLLLQLVALILKIPIGGIGLCLPLSTCIADNGSAWHIHIHSLLTQVVRVVLKIFYKFEPNV